MVIINLLVGWREPIVYHSVYVLLNDGFEEGILLGQEFFVLNLRRVENYFIVRVGIGSCRTTCRRRVTRRGTTCRTYRRYTRC